MLRSVLAIFLLTSLLLVSPVRSLSIVCPKEEIGKGEIVRIQLYGLEDGTEFDLEIEGTFSAGGEGGFRLEARNFTLPFSLIDGSVRAQSVNTTWTGIAIRKGGRSISATGESWRGVFEMTESMNATPGLFEYLQIEGGALQGHEKVTASIGLKGRKFGPVDSEIAFETGDMTEGVLLIRLLADGEEVLERTMVVRGVYGTSSSQDGYLERVGSSDGLVELRGHIPAAVRISERPEVKALPAGWRMISGAYEILPAGFDLEGQAHLVFRIPRGGDEVDSGYPCFIAILEGDEWRMLPGSREDHTLSTTIKTTGTYALMTFQEEGTWAESAPASPWLAFVACSIAGILLIRRRGRLAR